MKMETFADGCHRYGWLINLLVMFAMFAYFVGGMRSDVNSLMDRQARVERVLDSIISNAARK